MSFVLSHRIIESDSPRRLAFVLHGALGSGQNFNRFIQRLARERPEYRYVLVDLRHHGESRGAPAPNTLAACAEDLLALGSHLGGPPSVVIGHSFGGKVAIEYARSVASGAGGVAVAEALVQVWALDAVPGPQSQDGRSEIEHVMRAVRAAPMPAASRQDVVQHLIEQAGLSAGLSQWMTTNLRRRADGRYEWTFELDAIEELIADYSRVDLWPFLAEARQRPEFRLVVAEQSDRWPPELRERARHLPAQARVIYHELERSGHWVHVDNPEGLLALLIQHVVA